MLDFSAMYASTMHAALLMLTGNYTETLGTLELELAATSCHIYIYGTTTHVSHCRVHAIGR